jgi:hypothetical protein
VKQLEESKEQELGEMKKKFELWARNSTEETDRLK